MKQYQQVLESRMKIRFHDCDPFNHLNNSRYIDYMIAARGEQLIEHYQLDIYQLAMEKGLGWVTAQTQIAYLEPAYLMEEVCIETRLLRFSQKSLHFEAIMWNSDKTVPKALMWTRLVHYHLQHKKAHQHTDALMDLFQSVVVSDWNNIDFDTRLNRLLPKKQSQGA